MSGNYDPIVYRSKAITMQRLMMAVTQGYQYWIGGTVAADRALGMAGKFADLYNCNRTTQQRYRRKQAGRANTRLFLYPEPDTISLRWWLLCTDPGCLENGDRERWLDAESKDGRLVWSDEYELVRLPYTKALARKYRDQGIVRTEGSTWRMQRACYEAWRHRLRKAVAAEKHGNNTPTAQAIYALNNAPGFRAVRAHVWDLRNYANRCRRATKLEPVTFGSAPLWMRPRRCREYPLSAVIRRATDSCGTWFPS